MALTITTPEVQEAHSTLRNWIQDAIAQGEIALPEGASIATTAHRHPLAGIDIHLRALPATWALRSTRTAAEDWAIAHSPETDDLIQAIGDLVAEACGVQVRVLIDYTTLQPGAARL